MNIDFDVNFDFTTDTPGFWDNFWNNRDGYGATNIDPDTHSPTLRQYHKLLWARKLPNGDFFDLHLGKDKTYDYLVYNKMRLGSDIMHTGYRYKDMDTIIKDVKLYFGEIENYYKYQEEYIRKLYTIGSLLIFPKKNSINKARGTNHCIRDRLDRTLECIRKYYNNEKSPLFDVLVNNKDFFDLFVDFKGYIDFFLLQDIVSEDYLSIKYFLGNDNFNESPLPQNCEDYFILHDKTFDFIDKRKKRMMSVINN